MEKTYPPYQLLKKAEIRVLELGSGCMDSPIVVSLVHVSLENPVPYEAISYVWGDGNDLQTITHKRNLSSRRESGIRSVTVTRNLRDALQHFRHPTDTKLVWADALCIDQQSTAERAQQVRLMREIYMKADRVLLWLGCEDQSTKLAIKFLDDVATFCQTRTSLATLEKSNVMGELARMLNVDELPRFDDEGALAATKLFERPWFKRIWVVQEVSAGQEVLVSIGHFKLPFYHLGLGATWLKESQFVETGTGAGSEELRNASIMWQKRFEQRESPADLLDDGRDLLATDSRDKVYGLLGFTALRKVDALVPTYDKTVEEVYTDTSIAIIESTRHLDVLSFAEGPPCTDDLTPTPENLRLGWPNTPTWVARWDEQTYFPTSAMCGLSPHKLRVGPPASAICTDARDNILIVEGQMIDEVVYVAPYVHWPESPDTEPLPSNPRSFLHMWNAITAEMTDASPAEILSAWAQVLTGGITASYQPSQDNRKQHCADMIALMHYMFGTQVEKGPAATQSDAFHSVLRKVENDLPLGDRSRYQMAMVLLLSYRRVFLTKQGYLGLGHSKLRQGDVVAWLFGGRLPFVLRKTGTQWQYVGEGFLYNVRKGVMYVPEDCSDQVSTSFELR